MGLAANASQVPQQISEANQALFRRAYSLVVGTQDISKLAIEFSVKKSLKPGTPNSCDLKVRNLSEDTRLYFGMLGPSIPVTLSAGYADPVGMSVLFQGTVRGSLPAVTEGPDIVSHLSSGDKAHALAQSRINTNFAAGTSPQQVIQSIAAAMGVGVGNIGHAVQVLGAKGVASMFSGAGISGKASYWLNNLCKSSNLEWSVQNGALQFLEKNKPLNATAIILSASTGLLGSPSVDNKGVVQCSALLIPGLTPGRLVSIQAKSLQGVFRIFETEAEGQSYGDPWQMNLSLKKYSTTPTQSVQADAQDAEDAQDSDDDSGD